MPSRATVVCLLPCALLLCTTAARADDLRPWPRFLRLEYIRGAVKGCPEQVVLENAVLATARRDPFNRAAAASVRVTIARRGLLYTASLELRDGAGNVVLVRAFDPTGSCDSLIQDVGFMVGDRLRDPPVPPAPPKPELARLPAPAPAPAPAPPKREPPPPPLPRPERLRLDLGLAGAFAIRSAAPALGFNLVGDAGIRWRSFSIAAELRWTPPQGVDLDESGRTWVSVMQLSEGIVPCGHVGTFFFYCGVGQVMEVLGKSSPGLMPPSATAIAVATGARLGVDVPSPWWAPRFALRLSVDGLVTLHDAAVLVDDGHPPSWTTPGFALVLGAGIAANFDLRK